MAKLSSRARNAGTGLCNAWPAYSSTRTGVRATLVQIFMKSIRSATKAQRRQRKGVGPV